MGDPTGDEAEGTTVLHRPVGEAEPRLIEASGWRAFPRRLARQPILYPVLNEEYAVQIARDRNTNDAASGYAGCVTCFRVRTPFVARHPVQTVGARMHQELWIPAEELDELNANIVGPIEVTAGFRGVPSREIAG